MFSQAAASSSSPSLQPEELSKSFHLSYSLLPSQSSYSQNNMVVCVVKNLNDPLILPPAMGRDTQVRLHLDHGIEPSLCNQYFPKTDSPFSFIPPSRQFWLLPVLCPAPLQPCCHCSPPQVAVGHPQLHMSNLLEGYLHHPPKAPTSLSKNNLTDGFVFA